MDQIFKQRLLAPVKMKLTIGELGVIMEALAVFAQKPPFTNENYVQKVVIMGLCNQGFLLSKRILNKTMTPREAYTLSFNWAELGLIQVGLENLLSNKEKYNGVGQMIYAKIHQKTISMM